MIHALISAALAGPPAVEALTYQRSECERLPERAETSRLLTRLRTHDERDRLKWSESIPERDAQRVSVVQGLVAERRICSPQDHYDAAVILQRSVKPEDQLRAHVFAFHAMLNGIRKGEKLAAVTYDRWQVSRGLPQWYGTQYRTDTQYRTCLIEIDPQATDADREAAGLPPLKDVVRRAQEKNGREPIAEGLAALGMSGLYCPPVAWQEGDGPLVPFVSAFQP